MTTQAEERTTFTGVLETMSAAGDIKVRWDKSNDIEVAAARAAFDAAKAKGYTVLRVEPGGDRDGQRMTTFDPDAERLVAVPQMAGG